MTTDVNVTLPGDPFWLRATMHPRADLPWCDLLKSARLHDETYSVLCGCVQPSSPHRFVPNPTMPAAEPAAAAAAAQHLTPPSTWAEFYELRQLPSTSAAALLLSWPLTVYDVLVRLGLLTSVQRPVLVHYLGPEKEVLFLPLFRELLDLLPPGCQVSIDMIGPLSVALPPVSRWTSDRGAGLTITVRKGLYHARAAYLPTPDVVIAPNAGLAVAGYAERWRDTLHLITSRRLPFVLTDYSEQSVEKAIDCARGAGMEPPSSGGVCLNPFRMPLREPLVRGGAVGLPTISNGFLAAFHTPKDAFSPLRAYPAVVVVDAGAMGSTMQGCESCAPVVGEVVAAEEKQDEEQQTKEEPAPAGRPSPSTGDGGGKGSQQGVEGAARAMSAVDLGPRFEAAAHMAAHVGLTTFDADASPQSFETFFRAAVQLGVVSELEVEVMRRAIQTGRRTERWCISEQWAKVAQGVGMSGRYRHRCELSEAALEEAPDEARTRAKAISPRHSGEWLDESGEKFSFAACLNGLATPRWLKLKEIGNDCLKAGECGLAADWYHRAASLTDHEAAVEAFFEVLEESSSQVARRLADSQDALWGLLHKHLPDAPRKLVNPDFDEVQRIYGDEKAAELCSETVTEPNLPRAICLANAAAARLRQAEEHDLAHDAKLKENPNLSAQMVAVAEQFSTGLLDQALSDAEAAMAACPEYQKGHFRAAQVLKAIAAKAGALGMDGRPYRKRAEAIEKAMARYNTPVMAGESRSRLWSGAALVHASILKPMDYELVYALPHLDHEIRRVDKSCGILGEMAFVEEHEGDDAWQTYLHVSVVVHAELYNSNGGQILILSVRLEVSRQARSQSDPVVPMTWSFDGMGFHILDDENGDMLDADSPNGRASALSLQRYPPLLSCFLAELTSGGIHIDELYLNNGLTGEFERVRDALQAQPGYEHINVYSLTALD